jgi:hypothetical protein
MKRFLLVEPNFPIPAKSKNHKDFLPIGLLKIARYLQDQGHEVRLVRGLQEEPGILPDEVWVTSLFTYWARYVREAVQYYREIFPNATVKVGGVYASLRPPQEVKEYTNCDEVHQGVLPEVEMHASTHFPAYDLIQGANPHPVDYQILHASRGCPRKCPFCGTWRIEPAFEPKRSIRDEIQRSKIIFYDNNFLMNPYIEDILEELIELRTDGEIAWVESQSGLDGRVLLEKPHLARMLKEAGFRYPRIAWDWGYDRKDSIKKQIDLLVEAGYRSRDVFVFMLYNYEIPYEDLERKRVKCWEWRVQIADCRYRPLDQLHDSYNSYKRSQDSTAYYIHPEWTDELVRQFRRNVRRQNICVRYRFRFYSRSLEKKRVAKELSGDLRDFKDKDEIIRLLDAEGIDYWFPD